MKNSPILFALRTEARAVYFTLWHEFIITNSRPLQILNTKAIHFIPVSGILISVKMELFDFMILEEEKGINFWLNQNI